MKIESLKEGLIVKNYKELCGLLEIKVEAGNSKKAQLKELERFIKYHKEGNKFVIDEIYDKPLEKVDGRSVIKEDDKRHEGNTKGVFKKYTNLKIKESEYDNIGVYKITLNDDIYIGSTISGFRERFKSHYYGSSQSMKHTYELLQNGGVFEVLHDMTDIQDEELVRMVESEFINEYPLNSNWNVINKYESSISYNSKYKKKLKTLRIEEDKFYEAIQLLVKHGLIDREGVEL